MRDSQTNTFTLPGAPLSLFQSELQAYIHYIPAGEMVTKKRFLSKLRNSAQFERYDQLKRFYELTVETQFKSVMRGDCRVIINY